MSEMQVCKVEINDKHVINVRQKSVISKKARKYQGFNEKRHEIMTNVSCKIDR